MNRDDESRAEDLGDDDVGAAPFGVADYLQLAGMGRRSVVLEIRGHVAGRGRIVVRRGEVWSAHDERGAGIDAFRRLVFLRDAAVTCEPLDANEDEHNVRGSCEEVLFEAARLLDEALAGASSNEEAGEASGERAAVHAPNDRAASALDDAWELEALAPIPQKDTTPTALPPPPSSRSSVAPSLPPPPRSPRLSLVPHTSAPTGLLVEPVVTEAERSKPTWRPPRPFPNSPVTRYSMVAVHTPKERHDARETRRPLDGRDDREGRDGQERQDAHEARDELSSLSFEELYERGVDGLLAKDYFAAFLAFAQANQLRFDARVTTNLTRLRQLGFGVTKASTDRTDREEATP